MLDGIVVSNDPVNWVDPSGLWTISPGVVRIGTIALGIGMVAIPEPITTSIGAGMLFGTVITIPGDTPVDDELDKSKDEAPPVPIDQPCEEAPDPPKTCQEIFTETGISPCEEYVVDYGYFYDTKNQAIDYLRSMGYSNVTCQESGAEAYRGPCAYEDGGRHYNCTSNGSPTNSIMSCPCCDETGGGAEITTIWKVGN